MLFDKNSPYLDVDKSVGLRWLRRGERRRLIYGHLDISRIELKHLTLKSYEKILMPHKMIDFLERYYSEPNLKVEDTEYWSLLMKRYAGNHKRQLDESDFIKAKQRLRSFVDLCEKMKNYGWGKDFKKRSFESYVSVLVAEDDHCSILFGGAERALIECGERDRIKLIDGHHRLACAYYLKLDLVPTALHYIGRVK